MEKKRLHLIGNAHIDAVWLWQWSDGLAEVLATFRSALDRIAEYPDFIFTASSAAYYAWVEEQDPAMFAEIRRRVAEGRWRIAGGWWVEPDCNLPAGESFVRQALLGQRAFRRMFGRAADVGYNVDSFGHHAALPQLLAGMGLRRYVFMRPDGAEMELPASSFWWEGIDGSRVLAYRVPFAYTTKGGELDGHIERCIGLLSDEEPELMCFYGVGNHGGGATRANIESIRRLAQDCEAVDLVMSSPDAFFDSLERRAGELPVVRGELQHHSRGCYSAHSEIKRLNRAAERRLLDAERLGVVASLLTGRVPELETRRAWPLVLFNQFHDTLAGTAVESAYDDAREQYGEALSIASRSLGRSLQALAWSIDIPAEAIPGKPFVVFNPHPFDLREVVEMEFLHDGQVDDSGILPGDELVDDEGTPHPYQLVQSQATLAGRTRICFHAEVAALGYRLYRMRRGGGRGSAAVTGGSGAGALALSVGRWWAENEELRIEVDPTSGSLARLYDKAQGIDLLSPPGAGALVLRDASDTWSHGVARYDETIGEFASASLRVVESGPVRVVIRSTGSYGASTLVQDFVLARGARFVEVRVRLDWHEHHRLLKLRFPAAVEEGRVVAGIPFGVIERKANGEEEPAEGWIDLSGRARGGRARCGLCLATGSKHGYSAEAGALLLTAVRSPIYAHHRPAHPQPDLDYTFMDQGEQRFAYRLAPHPGDWREARAERIAATLDDPFLSLAAAFHPGRLPGRLGFLTIDRENIAVTAIKWAEEGDDLILRLRELSGERTAAVVRLGPLGLELREEFRPFEIKTFRIPREAPERCREVNLLEERPEDFASAG